MARDSIPSADVAELLAESTAKAYGLLIEITHPLLVGQVIRLTDNGAPVTANGEDYLPTFIALERATQEETRIGPARLVIGALSVAQQVVAALRTATNPPPLVVAMLVDLDAPDVPKLALPPLEWRGIRITATSIEGALISPSNPYEEPYPATLVTPFTVPGVFGISTRA